MPKKEALINLAIPASVLVVGILAATILPIALRTELSRCGIAESDIHFAGESLMHNGTAVLQTMRTDECEKLDREIDGGNGPQRGRIRWVKCLKGRDCNRVEL